MKRTLHNLILYMDFEFREYSQKKEIIAWIPSVIIFFLGAYWIINRGDFTFIDNADLVIHEAGHFFFMFFGKFIYTLGGTLMQILLPSLIAWYFFRNFYKTGVQFALLWLGQNLINISVYAADAQERLLPLLGGSKVYHDWHYILGELGILHFDDVVGYIFVGFSVIIFIVAILMPLIIQD
ncbi:MAG: hypothetical protein R6W90_11565 [Ignavibacteriaceae bacterium]